MKGTKDVERGVVAAAKKALVGKKVVAVRYMAAAEANDMAWDHRAAVVQFDDGTLLFAMCDEEGNDAGVLIAQAGGKEVCLGRLPA